MSKIIIGILLLLVLGGGAWYLNQQQSSKSTEAPSTSNQQNAQNETLKTSSSPMVDSKLESQAYVNTKYGFKIRPPKGWKANENIGQGALVYFSNPDQSGIDAGVSISIGVMQITKGASLDSMTADAKKTLPAILINYTVVEERKAVVNGYKAHILGGTFVDGKSDLRNRQLSVIVKDTVYVITGTDEQSTWDKNQDLIESSLMSFEIQEK